MGELIKEGKIRHWGVSVAPEEYIRRAHKVTPISAVQDRYSMMARGIEKLFPTLEELGIGFVAYSPLANGLLSGAYEKATNKQFEAVVRLPLPHAAIHVRSDEEKRRADSILAENR